MNLIKLPPKGRVVFVGDTHGDVDASIKVISEYLNKNTSIVFLGDYVDRGNHSQENIDFLLDYKKTNPENIFLLQGNHERYDLVDFSPNNFWEKLNPLEKRQYLSIFKKFPLAISVGNILALHGALPDINHLQEINKIGDDFKDKNLFSILWGDFIDSSGEVDDIPSNGRPYFGERYFNKIIKKLNKKVLIRSHQSDADQSMFNNKCLTLFTSSAYSWKKRKIAIADFSRGKEINSIDDLIILEI